MKDPHIVNYKDLISETERQVAWMKKFYPVMVSRGEMHSYTAQRRLAVQQTILRLLKKHDRNRQLNLQDMMEGMKQAAPCPLIPPPIAADQTDDPNFFTTSPDY